MQKGLQLKIGKYWCTLKEDTSISIEMTSPLWNDSGSFSYSFSVPYSSNRHIFNAADSPESDVNLKSFREHFELYVNGIGFLFGDMVCSSDEIDLEDDSIDLELRSGNATFEDAINGKTLRDLELKELIGFKSSYSRTYNPTFFLAYKLNLPGQSLYPIYPGEPYHSELISSIYNLHNIYPEKHYINIPILTNGKRNDGDEIKPLVLSPLRSFSSPCFYVLFLLERCFSLAGIHINENVLLDIEDMRRLIILNTKFEYDEKNIRRYPQTYKRTISVPFYPVVLEKEYIEYVVNETSDLYASVNNLPDTSISDFFVSLKNAFGIRLLVDDSMGGRIILIRDVLRSNHVTKFRTGNISSITKKHISFSGVVVKYDTEDGDEFSYSSYSSEKAYDDYASMLGEWMSQLNVKDATGNPILESDRVLKIVKETGNFYRTKVDKDKYDSAQLFEVAQFLNYTTDGDENNSDEPDELTISFNPIIPTQVPRKTNGDAKFDVLAEIEVPDEAFYVDVEVPWKDEQKGNKNQELNIDHVNSELIGSSSPELTFNQSSREVLKNILEYDCELTFGIVRTTPEDSDTGEYYEIIKENWDGFGNDEWAVTVSTNTVTSDSITKEGSIYDYNGSGDGIGVSTDQLISLKLWSGKQNFNPSNLVSYDESGNQITGANVYNNNPTGPLPNRGLVPQFLSEYLHFLKHRKTLEIVAEVEIAELVNIQWEKYYYVAGYKCLFNKISFDISDQGIGLVTMEVYCI